MNVVRSFVYTSVVMFTFVYVLCLCACILSGVKVDKISTMLFLQDKFPVAVPIDEQDNKLYAVTFITCGIIAAVFVSSVALYFLRKQSKLKDKLPVPHEKKVSKNYQVIKKIY